MSAEPLCALVRSSLAELDMLGLLAFLEHSDFPADQQKYAHNLHCSGERECERENMKLAPRKSFCVSCSCSRVECRLLQVIVGVLIMKEAFVWSIPLMSLFLRNRMAVVAAPVFTPLTWVTASNRSFCES